MHRLALCLLVLAPGAAAASGTLCFATALNADCTDAAEGAPARLSTLFRLACFDESGDTPAASSAPTLYDAEGVALEDALVPAETCGEDVYRLSECVPDGEYLINSADDLGGSGGTRVRIACASASGSGGDDGGCQQVRSSVSWGLGLLLLALGLGRRRTGVAKAGSGR